MQKFRIPGSTPPTNTTTSSQDVSPSYPNHYDNASQNRAAESKRKPNEMQTTRTNNVQSYIDELIEKASTGENLIKNLTPNTALEILQVIHYRITHSDTNGKSKVADISSIRTAESYSKLRNKEHLGPGPGQREDLLNKYLEAIKTVSDKKKRALLAYYAVSNLRFFEDGNGRTSRAIYYALLNGSVKGKGDIIIHQRDGITDSDKSEPIRKDFYINEDIISIESINELADILLQKELIDKGYLEKRFSDTRFLVTSNQDMRNGGYTMESYYNSPIQTEENEEILRKLKEEKSYDILYALSDSGARIDHSSSLSGLALATILQSKGKLRDITESYPKTYGKRFEFTVNFDPQDQGTREKNEKMARAIFAGWGLEDYKNLIHIYTSLKQRHNEIIISIFTDNLCFCDDWSIADWAVSKPSATYPNRDYKSVNKTPTDQNTLLSEFLFYNN